MRQRTTWFILLVFVVAIVAVGCGNSQAEQDKKLEVAAFQYARGEVQSRLPSPNSAVFPGFETVNIIEHDDGTLELSGRVAHTAGGQRASTNFNIIVYQEGNGLWRTESLDLDL
ncbi:hypothetical protein [Dethiobacter alkaliphilus]|uniref:Lipoprotein n=1 Tax=Dethiobacter alkaliphilus AHT 1 TaxID=555088 RepID=C0GG31_DETAL|nr:hypothetical protein [Dethiobacter alkaliphilus]EEG77720.1 hypothetical protein DealDRAFT_1440 [Dethiobacter alkaliphilus AHT 1]